jgi:hypothetical protein
MQFAHFTLFSELVSGHFMPLTADAISGINNEPMNESDSQSTLRIAGRGTGKGTSKNSFC